MSVRNDNKKHLSAEAADKFEEKLEGGDWGDMEDWEAKLLEKIIKTEILLDKAGKIAKPNPIAIKRLEEKMVRYNVALEFLTENVKVATSVGAQGGLDGIMAYLTKDATEVAAKKEVEKYSAKLIPHLPGQRLNAAIQEGGRVPAAPAVAGARG